MAGMIRKTFEIKVLEKRKDGGRIAINTGSVDRDRDRVFPRAPGHGHPPLVSGAKSCLPPRRSGRRSHRKGT